MRNNKFLFALLLSLIIILLSSCGQNTQTMIAFTHVNLIPMTSERVISDQTVLISGSKIAAIGDTDELRIPIFARTIDANGAYLLPGLADMHMHTRADWEDPEIWPVHPLYLYLANGVTTIRDFAPDGSPIDYALQWRQEIRDGTRIGPTIYTSGKLLYASPLDDPMKIVRQNYEMGFDFLKLYSYLSREDFYAAIAEAEAVGMYTAGHIPYALGLDQALAEGMDEIAHVEELLYEFIEFDRRKSLSPPEWARHIAKSALLQFGSSSPSLQIGFALEHSAHMAGIAEQLRAAQVPVCTTLVIDEVIQLKLFQPETFLARQENIYLEAGYLDSFLQGEEKHQVQCRGVEGMCAFKNEIDRWILQNLHGSDVVLLLGTDAGTGGMGITPGFSIHDELRILVENGFTPYEALLTGTVNAANVVQRMTGVGDFGTVEVGKRADLILIRQNPFENIEALRKPLGVMAAGRWYPVETLEELIKISEPAQ